MSDNMIVNGGCGEIEEKKSRFIANIKPVSSEKEAIAFIAEMKKKYWDAKHNCMAYIVGDAKRFSDDGEPSGTAGKPMLDMLEGKNITNAVVVVTRYFGGILLGTGGLVRAYQGAVAEGLRHCEISEKCEGISTVIETDYSDLNKIQYIAEALGVDIADTEYLENVRLKAVCEKKKYSSFINKVTETTAGKAVMSDEKSVIFYRAGNGVNILSFTDNP